MLDDPPRRRRRSSLSEHIQRVFNVDRPDKKIQSSVSNNTNHQNQTDSAQSSLRNDQHKLERIPGRETPTEQSVPDETGPSSLTYSSLNSRIPSISTPNSSPSVQPVVVKYEDTFPQPKPRMTPDDNIDAERLQICSSPTWNKDDSRKERRATKRLEAERKELEKRLLHLEEAQARLDHGVYERNSRRLTKKQPLSASHRSSSANTERPRSSSAFSAFFSSSRRSSRSRASSVNEADRVSSHRSSSDNPNGPPTLPLVLPERFGVAVSRELANRHGTSLVPSHQLQQPSFPKLHTTTKTDDLRESWKMAEAWTTRNDAQNMNTNVSVTYPEIRVEGKPVTENNYWGDGSRLPQPTELSADLDREKFTANLRRDDNALGTARSQATTSVAKGYPVLWPTVAPPKNNSQSERQSQIYSPMPTHITTNLQLRDLTLTSSESAQSPHSPMGFYNSSVSTGMASTGNLPQKQRRESNSNAHSKTYKPSPLSLNPAITHNADQKRENKLSNHTLETVQSPRSQSYAQTYQHEEHRRRSQKAISAYCSSDTIRNGSKEQSGSQNRQSFRTPMELLGRNANRQQENGYPRTGLYDNGQQKTAGDSRRSTNVIPPQKHPGRKSPMADNLSQHNNKEKQRPSTGLSEGIAGHPPESVDKRRYTLVEFPANPSPVKERSKPGHSRTSSGNSSRGASSYDTADEEVFEMPSARFDGGKTADTDIHPGNVHTPAADDSGSKAPDSMAGEFRASLPPPLAPGGAVNLMRRKPMQKIKPPRQDETIAKLFVICCHCKYWHDMPSEVYAKLACPERLSSESLLVRTFSGRRRGSLGGSIFSSDPNDPRRLPMPKQRATSDGTLTSRGTSGSAKSITLSSAPQAAPLYRPQCCWCGHSMGRSCCQGWTTIVQMRERHH